MRRLIVTGTDPVDPRGGIGVAMQGFLAAADREGLLHRFLPTYHRRGWSGKWRPALEAVVPVVRAVRAVHAAGDVPVVWGHAGELASIVRETALLRAARAAGARTMLQVHAPTVERYLADRRIRPLVGALFRAADQLCALTPYWVRLLAQADLGPRVALIPDPLPPDAQESALHPRPRAMGEGVKVLVMTRLVPEKRADLVLEALVHLPPTVTAVVAGEGSQRGALGELARRLGVSDRVVFPGWVAGEEKARLLAESDVFCLPSTGDSFGMGFVEAMARGLPVVAARFGAVPDVVRHGRTGMLVDRLDGASVAAALQPLLEPSARLAMGEAARGWVLGQFSLEAVGRRISAAVAAVDTPADPAAVDLREWPD